MIDPLTWNFARFAESEYSSNDRMDSLSLSNDSQASTSIGDLSYLMVPPKPPRYGIGDIHTLSVLSELSNARSSISNSVSPRSSRELSRVTDFFEIVS